MDKKLLSLLSLYGDPDVAEDGVQQSGSTVVPESSKVSDIELVGPTPANEELRPLEFRRLSEAKFVLENRARIRPDAAVIDAIVREANAQLLHTSAPTRLPLRLIKGLSSGVFPLRYAVAASIVLFAVVIGWSRLGGIDEIGAALEKDAILSQGNVSQEDASREKQAISAKKSDEDFAAGLSDSAPAEMKNNAPAKSMTVGTSEGSLAGTESRLEDESVAGPAGRRDLVAAAAPVVDGFAQVAADAVGSDFRGSSDSLTGWDDGTRMRVLQRRIESLRENNIDLAWDQPAVPLEQLVRVPSQPGVLRARSQEH